LKLIRTSNLYGNKAIALPPESVLPDMKSQIKYMTMIVAKIIPAIVSSWNSSGSGCLSKKSS